MCDILPPKMSERATDLELEASLTSMDWLPKLNVQAIRDAATVEKDKKSGRKSNGDSENDGPSKDGKPPYSYANLIQLAINSSENKKMTLSEIYSWICENFPYYQDIGNGWKNSIRHNLSLNKCFTRVARTKNDPGKGSYWTIDTSPQEDPLPFRGRKRKSGEISGYELSPNACYDASGELSSPSFTPGSGQTYSAMTSPEHAGSPPHHSTPLNHFHSPPLPHNDHNNNLSMNLANLPLNDLSASFKSLYRSVIQPTSQVFNRSNASICSADQQVNRSYNSSSCSAQSFNNSNSHSIIEHRHHRNHMNHISPLAQTHMTSQQPVHLDSSVESTSGMMHRRHYNTRSHTSHLNNSVTLNQVNKSISSGSGLNFDWSNIESLKNSFMNVNWPDVDFNQFPDLLENMQKADSNDWELDQQTALDLCSSLSRVFQQSGYGYQQHPSSSSVSTSSSSVDASAQMNRSYMQPHSQQHVTSPMIPNHHLSRSIPVSPPHAVAGDMRHVPVQPTLSGSAPQPATTQHMRQTSMMPPRYAPPQQPHQQTHQEEIIDTFDWDSIC